MPESITVRETQNSNNGIAAWGAHNVKADTLHLLRDKLF